MKNNKKQYTSIFSRHIKISQIYKWKLENKKNKNA